MEHQVNLDSWKYTSPFSGPQIHITAMLHCPIVQKFPAQPFGLHSENHTQKTFKKNKKMFHRIYIGLPMFTPHEFTSLPVLLSHRTYPLPTTRLVASGLGASSASSCAGKEVPTRLEGEGIQRDAQK